MLGLPKGEVYLCEYTDDWRLAFEREAESLKRLIGDRIASVHHIGSTAIPGLMAKPIIDIAVELYDFDSGFGCIELLSSIGYRHRILAELPDRHYWTKGEPRTHQIHMFRLGSSYLLDALNLRNRLRADSKLKARYEEMNLSLCNEHRNDKHAYAMAKTQFIRSVIDPRKA